MNYIEITILIHDQDRRELLIAALAGIGFDGFEETEEALKSFIEEDEFNEKELTALLLTHNLSCKKEVIQKQNWNKLWESNFEPVLVDDFVSVRADFHLPVNGVEYEILITPKMSFGTGHHATTFMMIRLMREIDFKNRTVFDFGTGTGILAILSEKMGAKGIIAVDNDDWCIENANENIQKNNCSEISIQKVNTAEMKQRFDVVIANINKHIILENIRFLSDNAMENGQILLSGLLSTDEQDIILAAEKEGWRYVQTMERSNWIALRFIKMARLN